MQLSPCGANCGALFMRNKSISGLKYRGSTYYLRMRVPAEFAKVEPRKEIYRSLGTADRDEAQLRCAQAKTALRAEWTSQMIGCSTNARTMFQSSSELLQRWGMTFTPLKELVEGPLEELLERLEAIADRSPRSGAVSAALGAVDLPDFTLKEMADRMPILKEAEIRAKNHRQLREWKGNFTRAAREFTEVIGKRTILSITEQDAMDYEVFWKARVRSGEASSNYATKQLRYVRQMIDAHFEDIRLPRSKRVNPLKGARIATTAYEKEDETRKKLPLPEKWIRECLIRDGILASFCPQASDIAIIAALCGCRFSEIYDLPAADIHLEHEVPHIMLRAEYDGSDKRQLKNGASTRPVVLLGHALEAMQRNPLGFPRYRGKAAFSGEVNKFLRDKNLFPELPENCGQKYVLSGLRHSFENRMRAVSIKNEERAFLMGHSIGRVLGRPVYGTELDLPSRAILQEMVAMDTENWSARPVAELWSELKKLLVEDGYKIA